MDGVSSLFVVYILVTSGILIGYLPSSPQRLLDGAWMKVGRRSHRGPSRLAGNKDERLSRHDTSRCHRDEIISL